MLNPSSMEGIRDKMMLDYAAKTFFFNTIELFIMLKIYSPLETFLLTNYIQIDVFTFPFTKTGSSAGCVTLYILKYRTEVAFRLMSYLLEFLVLLFLQMIMLIFIKIYQAFFIKMVCTRQIQKDLKSQ